MLRRLFIFSSVGLVLALSIFSAIPTKTAYAAGATTQKQTTPQAIQCAGVNNSAINWLICPVISAMSDFAKGINAIINKELNIPISGNSSFLNTTGNTTVYQIWAEMRNFALAFLVIIALIMVISQAIGVGPFDAYTVRKILPRIIISIILIALSWPITIFAIQFSNALGTGVSSLIYSVAGGNAVQLNVFGTLLTWLVAGAGLLALGTLGALSFIVSLIIGLVIGFVIIVFRQLIVMIGVITAPLAFVAYILPGTQKAWKFWRDGFLGALLLFPMITATIAVGQVLASIVTHEQGAGTVNDIMGLILYFGPYFVLPALLRSTSGIMAVAGGAILARGKGAHDGVRNFRRQRAAQNWSNFRTGNRFQSRRGPAGWVNRAGEGVGVGWRGHFGIGEQGRQARSLAHGAHVEETLKENPRLRQLALSNDAGNAVLALSGGSRRGAEAAARELFDYNTAEGRAEGERALAAASAVGFNQQNAVAALTGMAQNKSRAVGNGRYDLIENGINRLGLGAQGSEDLAQSFQFNSRQAGRIDLGGDWTSDSVRQSADTLAQRAARGGQVTAEGRREARSHAIMLNGIGRTDITSMARGHTSQVKQARETIKYMMENGTQEQANSAGMRVLELQNALPYATEENAREINGLLADLNLSPNPVDTGQTRTVTFTRPNGTQGQRQEKVYANLADQIATRINQTRATTAPVTGSELSGSARVFDRGEMNRDQMQNP